MKEMSLLKEETSYDEMFINQEQKKMINSCIEELEKSQEICETKHEADYEDVGFNTEQTIDDEDLEHHHVRKERERRQSCQYQSILTDSVNSELQSFINKHNSQHHEESCQESLTREEGQVCESYQQLSQVIVESERSGNDTVIEAAEVEKSSNSNEENHQSNSFFLTEADIDINSVSKSQAKRQRNRTIDYHSLPSLFWEASVQNYHEKKYVEQKTDKVSNEVQTDSIEEDIAKDGLSVILQK